MANYTRPDPLVPAIAEFGNRASMSATEVGQGWSTVSQTRPPADKFNERDFLTSSGVKYLCQLGIPEYSSDEQYRGRGVVIGWNNSVYWNLLPCQGIDPVGDTTGHWEKTAIRATDALDLLLGQNITAGYLTLAQANTLFLTNDYFWNQFMSGSFNPQMENLWSTVNTLWGFNEGLQTWKSNEAQPSIDDLLNWRQNIFTPAWNDITYWRNNVVNPQIGDLYSRANSAQESINALTGRLDGLIAGGGTPQNGWRQIGDLIQQWRSDYSQDSSAGNVYRYCEFPRTFPQNCFSVQVTTRLYSAPDNNIMIYQVDQGRGGWTTTGVNLWRARRGDDGVNTTAPIIYAIGN